MIGQLDRASFHIGVIAGWLAIAELLVTAAGWQRIAHRADGHLAWQVIPFGLVAAAGALLLGYGNKGALAEYLPGGSNENSFDDAGLYSMFVFNDNGPWVPWWGVVFAAAGVAWLSFRGRRLPLWLGIFSAVVVLLPTVVLGGTGAVAGAGVIAPLWITVASIWLMFAGEPVTRASEDMHRAP